MSGRMRQLGRRVAYAVFSNILYGFIVYFTFMWLVGYSLLAAYLGILVLIVAALAIDEFTLRMYQSTKLIASIKKDKNPAQAYRQALGLLESFVSFRVVLYLFYALVLVFSQIVEFSSGSITVGGRLGDFLLITRYNILLIIAFDMLTGQFAADKRRLRKIAAAFGENFTESPPAESPPEGQRREVAPE